MPNWRELEVEQLALKTYPVKPVYDGNQLVHSNPNDELQEGFIAGYNHNKAKYTEEDLRKAFFDCSIPHNEYDFELFIQSLQKYPKEIVMESEEYGTVMKDFKDVNYRPKLIINSENKPQGVIKEIIW